MIPTKGELKEIDGKPESPIDKSLNDLTAIIRQMEGALKFAHDTRQLLKKTLRPVLRKDLPEQEKQENEGPPQLLKVDESACLLKKTITQLSNEITDKVFYLNQIIIDMEKTLQHTDL